MFLVTSIPPRFSRIDPKTGEEIGNQYLSECIASWRRNGFYPVSLNRPDEADAVRSMNLIDVVIASMSEAHNPTRYGPSLGSLFDILPEGQPAAIVNADIYMLATQNTLAAATLPALSNSVVMGRRTDVGQLGDKLGSTFVYGFDYFAFDPIKIHKVLSNKLLRRFQLGAPWWVYVFPLLCKQDLRLQRIKEPFIAHLLHEERWNNDLFNTLATDACDALVTTDRQHFLEIQKTLPYIKSPGQSVAHACHARLLADSIMEMPIPQIKDDPWFSEIVSIKPAFKAPIVRKKKSKLSQLKYFPRDALRMLRNYKLL